MNYLKKIGKRGNLMEEFPGIIIFVVVAVIFVFAVSKVYGVINQKESDNAGKILDDLISRVSDLEELKIAEFNLRGLENWYLTSWSKDDDTGTKPDKCFFGSCLCICKFGEGNAKNMCQQGGFCKEIDIDKIGVYTLSKMKGKSTVIKDEEVIKNTIEAKYSGESHILIDGERAGYLSYCAGFDEDIIYKLILYKEKESASVMNVQIDDPATLKIRKSCLR